MGRVSPAVVLDRFSGSVWRSEAEGKDSRMMSRIRTPRPPRLSRPTVAALFWVVLAASAIALATVDQGVRYVLAPCLASITVVVWTVCHLWTRDGSLPIFEAGTVYLGFAALYACIPLVNFIAGGLEWLPWSDNRLFVSQAGPQEIGSFAWKYPFYLGSFAVSYVVVRRNATRLSRKLVPPARATFWLLILLFGVLTAYFWVVSRLFGVPSSDANMHAGVSGLGRLPLVVAQLSHNFRGALLIVKIAVLALVLLRWRLYLFRCMLFVWIGFECLTFLAGVSGRTEFVLFMLSAGLLYHRLVRPVGLRLAALGAVLLISSALVYGMVRDVPAARELGINPLTVTNEFQALFATTYDLHERRMAGSLVVPWQLYFSEPFMLVPAQLLPIQKIDPAEWYLDVLGVREEGVGFMFGVMAQAEVGFGWTELLFRAIALGVTFAIVHRWYVKRASHFWVMLMYTVVCVQSYYSFRASSFYWVYFLVYRFLPVMVVVATGSSLLQGMARRRRSGHGQWTAGSPLLTPK